MFLLLLITFAFKARFHKKPLWSWLCPSPPPPPPPHLPGLLWDAFGEVNQPVKPLSPASTRPWTACLLNSALWRGHLCKLVLPSIGLQDITLSQHLSTSLPVSHRLYTSIILCLYLNCWFGGGGFFFRCLFPIFTIHTCSVLSANQTAKYLPPFLSLFEMSWWL